MGEELQDPGLGRELFNMTPEAWSMNEKKMRNSIMSKLKTSLVCKTVLRE